MHTKMKPEEGRRFGIRLRNCPKSLKQIVQAYRLVALSFSGLEFDESEDNGKDGKADKPRKGGHLKEATLEAGQNAISLKSLFFIILNLGLMATYVVPFIYVELENFNTKENETEQQNYRGGISNNGTGILTVKDYLALRQFNAEFAHFKPILRNVMSMVLYVFIVEGFVNFAINGYTGGKLICCLAQVPNIQKLDTSKSFAVRRIGVILVSIVVIHAAGIALFNQKEIRTLRKLFFSKDFVLEANAKLDLLQLLCFSLMHILHYLILSMMPLLFLYTTTIFTKHLDAMSESIQTVELNETNLYKVKDKLAQLNEHYKAILGYFSLPLTFAMIANAIMIVGSSCFLMVNSNTEKYFGSLLFELGVFGFVRLLIVCSAGNQVTNAYRELIRVVFENVHAWNVDEWMCFIEIKRMRVQFAVTFLGTYSLRQSTILAVLAFCLNYIVVLLQTENYGTNSPGLSAERNNTWNQTEGQ